MLFEEFGDFFQQIPTILILYICVPLFGIGFGIVWYGWIKPRRNKANETEAISTPTTSSPAPMPEITVPADQNETISTDFADTEYDDDMDLMSMPDLNMLVNHTPEPTPQPIQKPLASAHYTTSQAKTANAQSTDSKRCEISGEVKHWRHYPK